jgi:SAM-dependent methyltransferase
MNPRLPDDRELLRARSYDEVAETYERVNAPLMFDEPARSLVECAALSPGEHVLDVGTGTGAVARAAIAAGANVVALDPSLPMLMAAGRGGVSHLVCGSLPELPFQDAVFDGVLSAFVMTHVDDPDCAARSMHRVLRRGGRVALSAWSLTTDEYSATWRRWCAAADADAAEQRSAGRGAPRSATGWPVCSSRTVCRGTNRRTVRFELNLEQMLVAREGASGRALRARSRKRRTRTARVPAPRWQQIPGWNSVRPAGLHCPRTEVLRSPVAQ